ncbi:MAG: hypothetical protein QOE19_3684 [Actinomycetota bacterium]|jgi:hypothetical protein|nr:hypothetical protein [Actinomycetota bacterium]
MTILEFLDARLAEDALTATAAIEQSPEWHAYYDYRDVKDATGVYVIEADRAHPTLEQAAHIARHDPARVLRDVETKRQMVARYRADLEDPNAAADLKSANLERWLYICRLLAAVYAGHPDYREDWRP